MCLDISFRFGYEERWEQNMRQFFKVCMRVGSEIRKTIFAALLIL